MRAAVDPAVSVAQLHGRFGAAARELSTRGSHWEPHDAALDEAQARIDRNNADGALPLAVATGYPLLDEVTGGYPPTLTVVFGQPGVAKTGFTLSTLRNIARRGEVGAVFAMEDGKAAAAFRWLAHESEISGFTLKYRRLENEHWHTLANADAAVRAWPARVMLDGRPSLRPSEILMAAHVAVRRHRARVIVLDNMTAVRFTRGPRLDLEIQDFLTDFRALATDNDVAVVVIAHAKRREGLKPGAIPLLTDCRESAAFEILARLAIGVGQDPSRASCITDGPMDERCPDGPHLDLGILKNTDGHPSVRLALPFRPSSAMLEDPRRW
jgi:replicative DNA helicase